MQNVCESCNKVLEWGDIKKGLDVGTGIKEVDSESLKLENGNLKILGILKDESEESGIFRDGTTWFIGFDLDKKNKSKSERSLMKFSYLRESLRTSKVSILGLISVRGKEHIVILKPYFNALVGLGLYHFDRIRDVKEISGYSENFNVDGSVLEQMKMNLLGKEEVKVKDIENKRNKMIEAQLEARTEMANAGIVVTKEQKDNPLELCSF